MIVLDEQLLEPGFKAAIQRWYRGAVVSVRELRPGSVILDEAIPALLRGVRQPTFVTIHVSDFWRRVVPDRHFAMLCFAVPDDRVAEVSVLLRRVLSTAPFATRKGRMGKVARVSRRHIHYYTAAARAVLSVPLQA
jgi:hypothetical protein